MKQFAFRKMKKYVLLCLLFWQFQSFAQEKPAGAWGLKDCIDYALKSNISIKQNELNVRTAENNLLQSKASIYPSINANISQGFNFGRSIDPFTNAFVNQQIRSNSFDLTASMTLYSGNRLQNTIKRNSLDLEVSRLNAEQTRYDASLNIAIAYLQILLNKELLEAAKKQVESSKQQLERLEKLFKAGSIAENDIIDLKATLANDELTVINSENQLRISKLNLMQLINLPADESFEVQAVNVENVEIADYVETPENIYNTAESTMPNIKSADMSIRSSEMSIEIAKSGKYPTLSLAAGLSSGYSSARSKFEQTASTTTQEIGFLTNNPSETVSSIVPIVNTTELPYAFTDQVGDNFSQFISLRLSIPIFNGWQVKNNINNAVLSKQNFEYTAQSRRIQLRQDIEQAWVNAKVAVSTYNARKRQVEALELSFETTEKRYEAGASNIVDFNLAKINLDRAKSDLIRAKYDYLFRTKVLDFYQNKPLDF